MEKEREAGVPGRPGALAERGGTGPGAPPPVVLSRAELRVAELAARGRTNRQIAHELFITVSTVEQHLTSSYRKLRVRRRAELPPHLLPDAPVGAVDVVDVVDAATG
ncbi:response regulator transcription factor [Kitasatospora sp. NPDC094019]|uniref:response regulator transcription factor n=1 Tax=Kitasatospora sp. NPDC094019 TaxID=3364091 RepID=UPI0038200EF5